MDNMTIIACQEATATLREVIEDLVLPTRVGALAWNALLTLEQLLADSLEAPPDWVVEEAKEAYATREVNIKGLADAFLALQDARDERYSALIQGADDVHKAFFGDL